MSVTIKVNTDKVLDELAKAKRNALEKCGIIAEGYAVEKCPVGKVAGGTLRQGCHWRLKGEDSMEVYNNVHYAMYVEYGTGAESTYPGGGASNKGSWVYPAGIGPDGKMTFKTAYPMKARPFIKPALMDHVSTYENLIKTVFSGK